MNQENTNQQTTNTASPSVEEAVTFIMEGIHVNTVDLIETSK